MNKKNKYGGMIFLEPDDAGGGGGGDAPDSASADPWELPSDASDAPDTTEHPAARAQTSNTPPAIATIDPKAFEAFGKSFGETFAKTQQAATPPAPPTPEQIAEARKALKFMDIDDNFLKEFGNIETQKQAFEKFRDGITQHIITVMNHLRGNDRTELEKMFNEGLTPVRSLLEERQNAERQQKFTGRFPQFASPEASPMIEFAISQLASKEAFKGKSESESFKLVADFLATQAKSFNPNFVLEDTEANGSSQPSRKGNSIPVTSRGSGASRTAQPSADKKGWALTHMK